MKFVCGEMKKQPVVTLANLCRFNLWLTEWGGVTELRVDDSTAAKLTAVFALRAYATGRVSLIPNGTLRVKIKIWSREDG